MLKIVKAHCGCEAEPLRAPFGFKGRHIDVLWQSAVALEDDSGNTGCAPGVQSVVWSDAAVIERLGQRRANEAMLEITRCAVERVRGRSFENPVEMIRELLDPLCAHAAQITGLPSVRPTFVLNALVPLDLAAWQLYARASGATGFDGMIPEIYRQALPVRHSLLAEIPLVSYNVGLSETADLARSGASLFKIKIGSDPDGDGDREKMLKWDMQRLSALHEVLREGRTPHTESGRLAYYLDANGRYDTRDRLMRLMDHLDRIGALAQTVLLEEPFEENSEIDVHDIPVRIAADESAHGAADARRLIEMGYRAMALKPIAKTLSVTLDVARCAHAQGIPCFCADLTVNPLLVDWNKNVAARLEAIPGMKIGVLESNGAQNYPDWPRLCSYHPMPDAGWVRARNGLFVLDEAFYAQSGGILMDSSHYLSVARGKRDEEEKA